MVVQTPPSRGRPVAPAAAEDLTLALPTRREKSGRSRLIASVQATGTATSSETSGSPRCSTRFAGWGRLSSLAVLAALTAALAWCLWVALTQETVPSASSGHSQGDAEFFRDVVTQVHAGHSYYDAADEELRRRGYVPHSVFNWRSPICAWLFGKPPSPLYAQGVLIAGALLLLVTAHGIIRREEGPASAPAVVVLLLGPLLWVLFPDVALFTELWAGLLIALSVAAYAHGRRMAGVAAGLFALFLRELALPYCLIALVLAGWQRRRREVAAWLAGLTLWSVFMTLHALAVSRRLAQADLIHAQGWIRWNGMAFVLLTSQINYYLLQAPAWLAALYLPLSLLGLAAWRAEVGLRASLTAAVFVAAFFVVGIKPHNAYWGLMYALLLPFGFIRAPAALRDLLMAALGPS